ncbi:hypothetical protein pipiens_008799, partial [Culex pipiens pipiens]
MASTATEHPAQRPLARAVRRNNRRKGRSPVQFGGTSGAKAARPCSSAEHPAQTPLALGVRRREREEPRNIRRKGRSPVQFGGTSGAKAARPCSSAEHPAQTPLALGVRRRERSEGGGTLQSGAGLGHGTPGANSARLWVSSACSHGTSGAKAARPCSSAEHPAQRPLARAVRRNIRRKLRSPLAFGGGKGQKEEVHYNLVQDLATEHPEQTPLACGFRRRVATEHPAQKAARPCSSAETSGTKSARPCSSADIRRVRQFEEETFWQKAKVQLKCDVPLHLQKVLVRTGYLNSALKDLTDAQIDKIEMDIRRLPELVNLPPGHPNVKSICGKFVEHSKDFAIMSGERALLLNLAKAVQDK